MADERKKYGEDSDDDEVYEEPDYVIDEEDNSEDKSDKSQTDIAQYEDAVEDIEIEESDELDDEIKYKMVEDEPVPIIKVGFPKDEPVEEVSVRQTERAPKEDAASKAAANALYDVYKLSQIDVQRDAERDARIEAQRKAAESQAQKEKEKRNMGYGRITAAEIKQEVSRKVPTQPAKPIYEPPYEDNVSSPRLKSIRDHIENEIKPIPRENILRKPNQEPVKNPFAERPREPTSDVELKDMIMQHRAKILVIGCGGAGNNTINRMAELGMGDVETIAVNTDAQDLLYTDADKKVLIGKLLTKGLGAGAIPKVGEDAAKEAESELKMVVQGADLVFITCGMGGGTGTGSAPVIADISRKMGALTVGIVTMPFNMEGARRRENARMGLEKLQQFADTLIIIPNDKLLVLSPDLPLHTAFKLADEILTNAVRGIANLITEPGLINMDFADVKTVMSNAGAALIGIGESDTKQRAAEAIDKAMNNPLLDADISGATGALVNISGGPNMTLDEARFIVEEVGSKLSDDARIIWGAQILDDLQDTIRVLLIVTGVHSKEAASAGGKEIFAQRRKKEIEKDLGIDFV